MAFTYSAATTGTRALDRVRFLVGDTLLQGHRLDDDEIAALLVEEGLTSTTSPAGSNERYVLRAAAAACRAIASALSKNAEIAITGAGPVKAAAADEFSRRADDLEARATPWLLT
jgi:hypothetical protein